MRTPPPRDRGGILPGRVLRMWNVETPFWSGPAELRLVRWADREEGRSPGGNRMAHEAVKNLSRAMVVVAVSDDVLKTPVEPVPPPGLAKLEPGLLRVGTLTRVEGSTLTYILEHGMCEPDLRAQVLEFEDLVIIGGSHGPLPAGGCGVDVGRQTTAVVTLATPLGDRAVISTSTGVRLTPLN